MSYSTALLDTSAAGLVEVRGLLSTVWPRAKRFTEAYLQWLYADNPAGPAVGVNAFAGDALVAHYATVPMEAQIEGRTERGLLSLNTATHRDHQGQGLFLRLANETYACAAERGYRFVAGVANANSTPGFVRRLGFDLVSQLDARVGASAVALRTAVQSVTFERRWTEQQLAWRLADPSRRYALHRGSAPGRNWIVAPSGLAMVPALVGRLPAGIQEFPSVSREQSATPLWIYVGLDPQLDWQRSWSLPVPHALRPSPLNLIFKSLTGDHRRLERASIRWQALDFDAY